MIGIGEPSSVPAGSYAKQVFTTLGTWDAVSAKANYGSDVRTVLTWLKREVDCGVVYATDAMTSDKVKVVAEAPEGSCDKIIYPGAIVASSANADAAQDFLDFLTSKTAVKIFESYGFTVIKQ
jgi:molybdate transport system substrate-binding protein